LTKSDKERKLVAARVVQERLKRCAKTAASARKIIETSKKLTEQSRDLVEKIHHERK